MSSMLILEHILHDHQPVHGSNPKRLLQYIAHQTEYKGATTGLFLISHAKRRDGHTLTH